MKLHLRPASIHLPEQGKNNYLNCFWRLPLRRTLQPTFRNLFHASLSPLLDLCWLRGGGWVHPEMLVRSSRRWGLTQVWDTEQRHTPETSLQQRAQLLQSVQLKPTCALRASRLQLLTCMHRANDSCYSIGLCPQSYSHGYH